MTRPKPTYTDVSVTTHPPVQSTAPNGSSHSTDYWTTVITRQDWPVDPDLGGLSGRSYRITERYVSLDPAHRGQCTGSSSVPWTTE